MSDFMRNLVLRAAGIAPVLEPQAATFPERADVDLEVEGIQAVEQASPPAEKRKTRERETPPGQVPLQEKTAVRPPLQIPADRHERPAVQPPEAPKVVQPDRKILHANRPETGTVPQPVAPVAPVEPEAPRPAARKKPASVRGRPRIAQHETMQSRVSVLEPVAREAPLKIDTAPPQRPPGPVREVVFVDRPALPPEMLDEVRAAVAKEVPEAPGRVEVHIGRIEIAAPRQPVSAAKPAPRQPRGFAEHGSERRYVRRRWY